MLSTSQTRIQLCAYMPAQVPPKSTKGIDMKLLSTTLAALATVAVLAFSSGAAIAGSAEDIIEKEKCSKCHTEKTTKKGPSWASVAQKYKGNAEAPNKIFLQLKNGGKVGDEDDHKKVTASDADIKAITAIVLSSK